MSTMSSAAISMSSSEHSATNEAVIKRNPHPNFKEAEARRQDWEDVGVKWTKTKDPSWKFGDGENGGGVEKAKNIVEIDPHKEGRPVVYNYKLLISGFVPRPVVLLSTRAQDGSSSNLAPFSYSQLVNDDPPIFVIGFSSPLASAKDSLRNLTESRECVLNIVSEYFVEAANACSINAPYGQSEWALSGLTPAQCTTVNVSRVEEAIFAIEGKLVNLVEFDSRALPGSKSGTLAIIEGTRFWVRSDALNEDQNLIDLAVLKPVSRLGGITYGRTTACYEMPRQSWHEGLRGSFS